MLVEEEGLAPCLGTDHGPGGAGRRHVLMGLLWGVHRRLNFGERFLYSGCVLASVALPDLHGALLAFL